MVWQFVMKARRFKTSSKLMKTSMNKSKKGVLVHNNESKAFSIETGLLKGYYLFAILFNITPETVVKS